MNQIFLPDAIVVAQPRDSTTGNFFTIAFRRAIRNTPKAKVTTIQSITQWLLVSPKAVLRQSFVFFYPLFSYL